MATGTRTAMPWTEHDDHQLVALARSGADPATVAAELGRTRRAITERVAVYVPDAAPRKRWEALQVAARAGFDVDAAVESHYQRRGVARWTTARQQTVTAAWRRADTDLAAVAARVGLSETHVADWLVAHGHAATVTDVARRLAPTPGGPVDQRARRAAARDTETVWVVTVIASSGRGAAVSLHPDKTTSGQALAAVVSPTERDGWVPVQWVIAPRTLRPTRDIAASGGGWADPGHLTT